MQPTRDTYTQLDNAYDYFNRALFDGRLPPCVMTLHRKKGAYGYFWGDTWSEREGERRTDEIGPAGAFVQNETVSLCKKT